MVSGLVWRLKQTDDHLIYQVYGPNKAETGDFKQSNTTQNDKLTSAKLGKRKKVKEEFGGKGKTLKIEKEENILLSEDSREKCLNEKITCGILKDYFQLDTNLEQLYEHWSSRDEHFKKVAGHFNGIRILRQEPVENLLSFVCSSNNHISRLVLFSVFIYVMKSCLKFIL